MDTEGKMMTTTKTIAEKAVSKPSRRDALKTLALGGAAAASMPLWARYAGAQTLIEIAAYHVAVASQSA